MHIFATGSTCGNTKRNNLSKTPSRAMHFLWHSWFLLRRGISKNGSSTMFGRLAQTCTMLMQLWHILKPGSSWHDMGAQAGKRAQTCLQPFWLNTRRVLWLMKHKDRRPWKENKEGGWKGVDHCASKGNPVLDSGFWINSRSWSHLPVPTPGLYAASTTKRKVCMSWYSISLQN